LFDDALQRVKHYELDQLYQSQAQSLVHASQDYFDEFTLDMPPAPPGLGFGHLLEAKARKWTDWKSTINDDYSVLQPKSLIMFDSQASQSSQFRIKMKMIHPPPQP